MRESGRLLLRGQLSFVRLQPMSDKALMDRSAESMREAGGFARGTGGYPDTAAGEATSHRSEVDQAPCCLAAVDRGAAKFERYGMPGFPTR